MPTKISFTEKNAYIRNMYDANGHKFKMITYANIPLVIGRAAPAKASAKAILPGQVTDSLLRNNSLGDRLIPSNELPCVAGQTIYDYCGNIVYKNGVPTIYRRMVLPLWRGCASPSSTITSATIRATSVV